MRIAIATVQVPFYTGGAEILASMLADELKKRGHQAQLVTIPFKWYPFDTLQDCMEMGQMMDLTEVNGEPIDIVIAMKFPAYYCKAKRKIIWLMHQHRQAYDLWGNDEFGDIHKIPGGEDIRDGIYKLDNMYLSQAEAIFTIAQNASSRLKKYNGIDSETLYHPPLGYDKLHCNGYGDYFFYPSRIGTMKRQRLMVEAARYVKTDVKMVVAGGGEEAEIDYINEYIAKHNLSDRVKLTGFISEEEKREYYANCLGVYFGAYDEDYGYITLESFFSKKTVIVHPDSGGPLEFVTHDDNGLIVGADAKSIAKKMDLLYKNKEKARAMGQAGYRSLKDKNMDWDYVIDNLLNPKKQLNISAVEVKTEPKTSERKSGEKPKMLYASPFWPVKSGISEYSENLVYGLREFFDVTLLIADDYELESGKLKQDFPTLVYERGKHYVDYDVILYNIGNQPYYHSYMVHAMQNNPGFIILHDFSLYYLMVGIHQERGNLYQSIYDLEGVRGIGIVKDSLKQWPEPNLLTHKGIASMLPMNREVIGLSEGILVHSNYAEKLIKHACPGKKCRNIELIKMSFSEIEEDYQQFAETKYGISQDASVVGSVGFIAPSKQNELCCRAIEEFNKRHEEKIYYLMIGEGDYADNYLSGHVKKTGFTEKNDYLRAIERCGIILNLRYPTNGETSATLIQCMSLGKVCIVTDIGWFSELPDDCVVKVKHDISAGDLAAVIEKLKHSDCSQIGRRAKEYVNVKCAPKKVAGDIFEFIMQ